MPPYNFHSLSFAIAVCDLMQHPDFVVAKRTFKMGWISVTVLVREVKRESNALYSQALSGETPQLNFYGFTVFK